MLHRETKTGRYMHEWEHAGFDRANVEWSVCADCMRFRSSKNLTKLVREEKVPELSANKYWD